MIDALCMSGAYPFRYLSMSTEAVASKLASEGFKHCLMFNLTALFHRDPWWANVEFAREDPKVDCSIHKLAVFNPDYEDKLRIREYSRMGYVGFVTSPIYHGYRLMRRSVISNLTEALSHGAVVILNLLEDLRQMHRAYSFRYRIMLGELSEALKNIVNKGDGEVKVLLSHFPYNDLAGLRSLYNGDVYVDFASSQVLGAPYNHVEELVKLYGASRLVLSTGFMMKYPKSSILKLQLSKIQDKDKEAISSVNAGRLYGIK
ncbi:amidohydrolase 2 [Caldivirga maquilingensis]|uniref:Amidohydrolase 2 n=1 Tax=Caldivirga maquilingensis (strain ATCC 700844 / DSM 13496 / JCM 10307 / IC-167) TaxID=397948 RepID=A8MD80_CALMQ|nr:amidohydrolase 2 [Caldivirga maquilingensis]ABW01736.1 amidohydrolase 2 [Caldivirga maquilingensis IC-167]